MQQNVRRDCMPFMIPCSGSLLPDRPRQASPLRGQGTPHGGRSI